MSDGKRGAFFVGNSHCEMETLTIAHAEGRLLAQSLSCGAGRVPSPRPVMEGRVPPRSADPHEAQRSSDLPRTVENLVVKPGDGTPGLAPNRRGRTSWLFICSPVFLWPRNWLMDRD